MRPSSGFVDELGGLKGALRMWSRIAAMPARTVDGMHAKIAFASKFYFDEREDLVEATAEDLLLSAAMDYADIHGQDAASGG